MPISWPVAKILEFVLGPHHGIIYRRGGKSIWIWSKFILFMAAFQSWRNSLHCIRTWELMEATSRSAEVYTSMNFDWIRLDRRTQSPSCNIHWICKKKLSGRWVERFCSPAMPCSTVLSGNDANSRCFHAFNRLPARLRSHEENLHDWAQSSTCLWRNWDTRSSTSCSCFHGHR